MCFRWRVGFGGCFGFGLCRSDAGVGTEGGLRELLEFLQAGQFVEIGEAEAHHELLRRAVEDGAANDFLASGGGDQALFEQRLDDATDIDAANLVDFGHGDGLLVGDDGERLQRGHGEAKRRLKALDEATDNFVVLWLGVELPAAGHFADFDAAVVGLE